MIVRFWGTRGSLATPGAATLRYGGNTSCVELRTAPGTLLIFDCGTGARSLGMSLTKTEKPVRGSILLGHSHWDHSFDTATWSKLTGARIIGSRTTCLQAQAQGVPAERCRAVQASDAAQTVMPRRIWLGVFGMARTTEP